MTVYKEVRPEKILMGKVAHEGDLLLELTRVCEENKITVGKVTAIGAVSRARVGYYAQDTKKYRYLDFDRHLEITELAGNISSKDGKPMVHAHITLADEKGNAFGGHLAEGTVVFACEFIIEIYSGQEFKRGFDEVTGLALWEIGE